LQAAEAWGVPPWEIAAGGSKLTWYARWSEYRKEYNKAMKEKARKSGG
jgi:hypothetical protein